jgi:hypothetical protein
MPTKSFILLGPKTTNWNGRHEMVEILDWMLTRLALQSKKKKSHALTIAKPYWAKSLLMREESHTPRLQWYMLQTRWLRSFQTISNSQKTGTSNQTSWLKGISNSVQKLTVQIRIAQRSSYEASLSLQIIHSENPAVESQPCGKKNTFQTLLITKTTELPKNWAMYRQIWPNKPQQRCRPNESNLLGFFSYS